MTGAVADGPAATQDRPPPAHTGGFGEPTCQACHFDGELNQGPGSLVVTGLPDHPQAGQTYTLTVTLTHPALRVAGFQLAIRRESDGSQAGLIEAAQADSSRVAVTLHDSVRYAHHTWGGTAVSASDTAYWTLQWTAPAEPGALVVHAVANAADDDASPLGDFIYTYSQAFSRSPVR